MNDYREQSPLDWEDLPENVLGHSMMGFHEHDDGRLCQYHSRLGMWTFEGTKHCLRKGHPEPGGRPAWVQGQEERASRTGETPLKKLSDHFGITEEGDGKEWALEPTKQRPGDQVLPTGDESLVDDQQLLIDDIEARRQIGIERYGQGHRPFNGRDTLQDLYEEQLDFLVYLRSIKRMADASNEELVKVISKVLQENGFQVIAGDAIGEQILVRLNGWVGAQMMAVKDA